jgi:hypothetical protein
VRRDVASGIALILGSAGLLVTMAFHPVAGSVEGLVRVAAAARGTHHLAVASIPVIFLGYLGLYNRLKADAVFAPAALVTFAFGSMGGTCAAILNGLVAPTFAERYAGDPAARATLEAILHHDHLLGSAFAKILMIASAAAIVLWSVAILGTRELPAWLAWLGCVLGGLELVGVFGGFMLTSVHHFGLFVLGMSAWNIVVGVFLCRRPAARPGA